MKLLSQIPLTRSPLRVSLPLPAVRGEGWREGVGAALPD